MKDLLSRLVKLARDAARDAREYERGSTGYSYYRGVRFGYMASARWVRYQERMAAYGFASK